MSGKTDAENAHLTLAFALHRELGSGLANSCFSPYSIASALGLVHQAARGVTAEELAGLLGDSPADVVQHEDLLKAAASLAKLPRGEAPILAVVNTVWLADGLRLRDDFNAALAGWPGAAVGTAPFAVTPEVARARINADVATTTRGLIPELLQPGSVNPDTRASVVNSLYLRAAWTLPFAEKSTELADFQTPTGIRSVPTMRLAEQVGYATGAGWQLIELPAAGGLEALILLPGDDLVEVESTMDSAVLQELLTIKEHVSVELFLPKFSVNVRSDLGPALSKLGVRTMFSTQADLSGLVGDDRIQVSDVAHQAVLRVDEQGFTGAAATAITMRMVSMPLNPPVQVVVDRPFLMLIRHRETGAVYFFSRIVDPGTVG